MFLANEILYAAVFAEFIIQLALKPLALHRALVRPTLHSERPV